MSDKTDRIEANALNPLLLDQLALIFARAALENFLQDQASVATAGLAGAAGCDAVPVPPVADEIDGQERRR